jgi:Ion channel
VGEQDRQPPVSEHTEPASRSARNVLAVASRWYRLLWKMGVTPLGLAVAFGYPWILFGFAPMSNSDLANLFYALSICAILTSLFFIGGTLYNPGLWDWRNFVTSLAFVIIFVANIIAAFSTIYLQADLRASCFSNPVGPHNTNFPLTHTDAVYFTLTTLTTVGYGDIHAVGGCRGWVSGQLCITLIVIGLGITTLATRIFPSSVADAGRTNRPVASLNAADRPDEVSSADGDTGQASAT